MDADAEGLKPFPILLKGACLRGQEALIRCLRKNQCLTEMLTNVLTRVTQINNNLGPIALHEAIDKIAISRRWRIRDALPETALKLFV